MYHDRTNVLFSISPNYLCIITLHWVLIIGDQEDEGTFFSLFQSNITNEAELVEYLSTIVFCDATTEQIQEFVNTYNPDQSAGRPSAPATSTPSI